MKHYSELCLRVDQTSMISLVRRTQVSGRRSRYMHGNDNVQTSVQIVLAAFRAVESRDEAALHALSHTDVEFHWPPSLPFGGSSRGGVKDRPGPGWSEVWEPLQPTDGERRMSPRVIAATDGEVVGLYGIRDVKFARAQMFYFGHPRDARVPRASRSDRRRRVNNLETQRLLLRPWRTVDSDGLLRLIGART